MAKVKRKMQAKFNPPKGSSPKSFAPKAGGALRKAGARNVGVKVKGGGGGGKRKSSAAMRKHQKVFAAAHKICWKKHKKIGKAFGKCMKSEMAK